MCPVSRSACAGRRLGGSLILSLIHIRVPRYITGYYRALSRHGDHHGRLWTAILNPEKRKVGGSIRGSATPPDKIDEVRDCHGCGANGAANRCDRRDLIMLFGYRPAAASTLALAAALSPGV